MIDRFQRVLAARGGTVDYGTPPAGTIRFSTIALSGSGPWYMDTIRSHDRTLSEWVALINEWNKRILPEKHDQPLTAAGRIVNPFTTRIAAAEYLTELLARELKFRWLARKFIMRIRERIYARRRIGQDSDLYTTLPIPEHAAIKVRDRQSRTLYTFHIQTIVKSFRSALHYSIYGIANPVVPKNPYTNVPWTYVQNISITGQVLAYYALSQYIFRPSPIVSFIKCGYSIDKYYEANKRGLQAAAAVAFFDNIHDDDLLVTRNELINDLYETIGYDVCDGWRVVKTIVIARLIPSELQTRWESVFLATWCSQNLEFLLKFKSFDDVLEEFETLHGETYAWWLAQPKRILRRGATGAAEASLEDS